MISSTTMAEVIYWDTEKKKLHIQGQHIHWCPAAKTTISFSIKLHWCICFLEVAGLASAQGRMLQEKKNSNRPETFYFQSSSGI